MATIHFGIDSYKNTDKQDFEDINKEKKNNMKKKLKS